MVLVVIVLAWVAAAAILLAIELHHVAFFALFASLGCVGGALVAAVRPQLYVGQFAVALVLCALGIWLARPYVSQAFARRHEGNVPRGVHGAFIGSQAVVIDSVTSEPGGHIRFVGENYLALSSDHTVHATGDVVRITAVAGTTFSIESLSNRPIPSNEILNKGAT